MYTGPEVYIISLLYEVRFGVWRQYPTGPVYESLVYTKTWCCNFEGAFFLYQTLCFICSLWYPFLSVDNCSDPTVPTNGSIGTYHSTEGAEIVFGCNAGFFPSENMTNMCTSDGRWNPDPAELRCTGMYRRSYHHTTAGTQYSTYLSSWNYMYTPKALW